MRLSLFSDYALRVLMFAALKESGPFSLSEVATAYGISRHHLVKVVNHLARLGYLDTKRGRNGGIALGMKASEVRVGALVRRTESATVMVECFDAATNTCPLNGMCQLKGALAEAAHAFYATLDAYTLDDLVHNRHRGRMQAVLFNPPPK